jgi:hypothetical protein
VLWFERRYVAVYFSILYARYRAGVVTGDMLALPKRRLAAIGLLEALGLAAGMSAGGNVLFNLQRSGHSMKSSSSNYSSTAVLADH